MAELIYRIHPAIGVARLGDAPGADDFFIGPEVPGQVFRGARKRNGHILRQAARFRVFAYRRDGGSLVLDHEVAPGMNGVRTVRWTVHLANRKASFFAFDGLKGERGRYHDGADMPPGPRRNAGPPADWDIDPGPRTIAGPAAAAVRFDAAGGGSWPKRANGTHVIDYLGELRTDASGRLVVLGGRGRSGSTLNPPAAIPHYANNATWLDDISDGPVTAEVVIDDGAGGDRVVAVGDDGKAWCIVGPPDFAPEVTSVVTLYDLLADMAARQLDLPDEQIYTTELAWLRALNDELRGGAAALAMYRPDYVRDVFPLLERALQYRWVNELAATSHFDTMMDPALADPSAAAKPARASVFDRLRVPSAASTAKQSMPRLLGDEPYDDHPQAPNRRRLAITRTQYAILRRWREGAFDAPAEVPVPGVLRAVPEVITPAGLDRAALEACVGGAFYPGIEAGWQLRHAELFVAPFRIRHGAPSTYLGDDGTVVGAGYFSRQMAVPWQADFMECKEEAHPPGAWGWWPSQRPDEAHVGGAIVSWTRGSDLTRPWMVANWAKLGFVVRDGTTENFTETERDPTL